MEIEVKGLSFSYQKKRKGKKPYQEVLKEINISFKKGEFIGIAGRSGSGKSTFIQLLKGLLEPTAGEVLINGENPQSGNKYELFDSIGYVFQYPEHQLFASTVYEDISFGLKKQSSKQVDIEQQVKEAMHKVNLSVDLFQDRHPFDLSGGEKRRVALAGVLVLQPQVLILDEPTVGLDYPSRKALFDMLHKLNEDGVTIILVSHRWEDILLHTKRVVVLNEGVVVKDGEPLTILSDDVFLKDYNLNPLDCITLMKELEQKGITDIKQPWDVEVAASKIVDSLRVKQ